MPHKVRELAISYLRHYKSDFDTVKSKVGLLDEYISTSYKFFSILVTLPAFTPEGIVVEF